jgi:3-hydroxyacyl-[acyl-carrier-protein] dehydratase
MNRDEIKKIIPHREPMLLVDEASITGDNSSVGTYHVRGDEWFLQGHFPGNPVVPGVILCEILAQTGSVIIANRIDGATPFFTGLDKVKFRQKVIPGDVLSVECSIVRERAPFFFAKATGKVDGKLAVSAEFSFALVK